MLDLLVQLAQELIRELIVDELTGHVRSKIGGYLNRRRRGISRRAVLRMHRRNRDRLLNRLLTEIEEKV